VQVKGGILCSSAVLLLSKTKSHDLIVFVINTNITYNSQFALFDFKGFSGGTNGAYVKHTSRSQLNGNVKLGYIESFEVISDSRKGICAKKSVLYGVLL